MLYKIIHTRVYILFLFTYCPLVFSYGLQVSPVSLTINKNGNHQSLSLMNISDQEITVQIRVQDWSQKKFENVLADSSSIAASPPFIKIKPGGNQVVRLIKIAEGVSNHERAARLEIDELPLKKNKDNKIDFLIHYSIPLFYDYSEGYKHLLSAKMVNEEGRYFIEINNDGDKHAQLSDVSIITGKKNITIQHGLAGYILPNSVMRFEIDKTEFVMASNYFLDTKIDGKTEKIYFK